MRLPKQEKPVTRATTRSQLTARGVTPSGFACDLLCNALPEPARSICKAAC